MPLCSRVHVVFHAYRRCGAESSPVVVLLDHLHTHPTVYPAVPATYFTIIVHTSCPYYFWSPVTGFSPQPLSINNTLDTLDTLKHLFHP